MKTFTLTTPPTPSRRSAPLAGSAALDAQNMKHIIIILCGVVAAGCATTSVPDRGIRKEDQNVLHASNSDPSVGEMLLYLPNGYTHELPRLAFAKFILSKGSPVPVLEQESYLVLPANTLFPRTHYLRLDQQTLLIYREYFDIAEGAPPTLQVLHRLGISDWSDTTKESVPTWAQSPRNVVFASPYSNVTVTSKTGTSTKLFWRSGKLQPQDK